MLRRVRTAVFVSGGGTNLGAIIAEERAGNLPHVELALVLSSKRGVFALSRAEEAGIPALVVPRREMPDQASYEAAILSALREYGIEMIVLAGFLSILSEDFVSRFPKRIINVHPSLIPAFSGEGFYGLRVHEAALARGVKLSGATVHYVSEIPDGGEIIAQSAVPVEPNDTPETLQRRIMEQVEWKLLPAAAEMVAARIAQEAK